MIATVAEISGISLPDGAGVDSRSILSVLEGGPMDNSNPVIHHSSKGMFSIRQDDWKYIEGLGSGGFTQPAIIQPKEGGPVGQLFNLQNDPSEENDLFMKEVGKGCRNEIET